MEKQVTEQEERIKHYKAAKPEGQEKTGKRDHLSDQEQGELPLEEIDRLFPSKQEDGRIGKELEELCTDLFEDVEEQFERIESARLIEIRYRLDFASFSNIDPRLKEKLKMVGASVCQTRESPPFVTGSDLAEAVHQALGEQRGPVLLDTNYRYQPDEKRVTELLEWRGYKIESLPLDFSGNPIHHL